MIILTRLGGHRAIIIIGISDFLSVETSQGAGHGPSCLVDSHGLLSVQMVQIVLLGCCRGLMVLEMLGRCR